jgi:hypothetical protein
MIDRTEPPILQETLWGGDVAGALWPFQPLGWHYLRPLHLHDQLAAVVAQQLAGKTGVGMLGGGVAGAAAERQPKTTRVTPAIGACQELPLWRPLLTRFPDGEAQFPRWAAWPGMVFTAEAARALATWFEEDEELRRIVAESRSPSRASRPSATSCVSRSSKTCAASRVG